jgi:hypothetical protein
LDNQHLDIQWFGQSISYPVFMENFIIPQHLWDSGDNFYGQGVGHVDPAKAVNTFDPLTSGILVGSGPFACISVFASDLGKVGTGCASNSDGSRAGQNLGPGATALLQAYDFVSQDGAADPFLQFQRTYDNAGKWGNPVTICVDGRTPPVRYTVDGNNCPGATNQPPPQPQKQGLYFICIETATGTPFTIKDNGQKPACPDQATTKLGADPVAAQSGLLQEFKWADQAKTADVTISDLASVAACFGATAPTTACPAAQYNYWLQSAFHPDSANTISSEVTIVAAHLDDTYVAPFAWDPTALQNIVQYSTP